MVESLSGSIFGQPPASDRAMLTAVLAHVAAMAVCLRQVTVMDAGARGPSLHRWGWDMMAEALSDLELTAPAIYAQLVAGAEERVRQYLRTVGEEPGAI